MRRSCPASGSSALRAQLTRGEFTKLSAGFSIELDPQADLSQYRRSWIHDGSATSSIGRRDLLIQPPLQNMPRAILRLPGPLQQQQRGTELMKGVAHSPPNHSCAPQPPNSCWAGRRLAIDARRDASPECRSAARHLYVDRHPGF